MMKGRVAFIFLGILFAQALYAADLKLPQPQGPVNDFAKVIRPQDRQRLEEMIRKVFENTGVPIVILTMPHIEGYEYNEYANLIYNAWGIGKKGEDKGVLIFLTLKERKMRIETGYGVEGILPDGLVGEIRDRYMIPHFKENRFGEGLIAGVEAISKVLQEEGLPKKTKKKASPYGLLLTGIFFGLILFSLIFRSGSFQRRGTFGFPIYVGGFGSRGGAFGGGFGGFGGGMSGGGGAGGSF